MTLSVAEAATRLGISRSRVQALIASGRLPATRIGERVWMIQPKDLARVSERKPGRPPIRKED